MNRRQFLYVAQVTAASSLGAFESGKSAPNNTPNRVAALDSCAKILDPKNLGAFTQLARAVFDYPYGFRIPSQLRKSAIHRLARAERAYTDRDFPGIQTEMFVSAINDLVHEFGMPGFAETSTLQAESLRERAQASHPIFMGRDSNNAVPAFGRADNPPLSPLQAVYLGLELAFLKLSDSDYQWTPGEWDARYRQRLLRFQDMELWKRQLAAAVDSGSRTNIAELIPLAAGQTRLRDDLANVPDSAALAAVQRLFGRWGI